MDTIISPEEQALVDAENEPMGETMIKRAAAMAAAGASKYKVQKELGISQYFATKIWRDELFKKLVEDIGDDAVAASKAQLRNSLSKLAPLAIKALTAQLKKDNLQAAITVFRSMGVETANKDDDKPGGITLVLAGQGGAEDKTVKIGSDGKSE